MANFFATQWFLCTRTTATCEASGTTRILDIIEGDPAMPGLLQIGVTSPPTRGQGYARDHFDPLDNKIYFYEVDGTETVHYVGKVVAHRGGDTELRGKLQRIRLDGTIVALLAPGDDDWTANRPTS